MRHAGMLVCASLLAALLTACDGTATNRADSRADLDNGADGRADLGPDLPGHDLDPAPDAAPPPTRVRGVAFNPEVYNLKNVPYKSAWFKNYDKKHVRNQVIAELRAIKKTTGLTEVWFMLSAFQRVGFPVAQQAELDRLVLFFNDVHAEGMRVVFTLGHPYIVPKSRLKPSLKPTPVCGHKKGDTVNGFKLYWDVPDCPENNIALSRQWHMQILKELEKRLSSRATVAYVVLGGHVGLPFAAEMNMFTNGYTYLAEAQAYVKALVPHLRATSSFPVGLYLMPSRWKPGRRGPVDYSFLDNVLAVLPAKQLDVLDITTAPSVDIGVLVSRVGAANAGKLVVSDFKPHFFAATQTQSAVIGWHLGQVKKHKLGGFWYWTYKDDPQQKEWVGLRAHGAFGAGTAGWRMSAVNAIKGTAP